MTIYLFDHSKALIGELDNVLIYEQTQILGGKISAEITAVYSKLVEDAHYFGSKDVDDPNIFWMYRVTSEKKRNGQVELTGIHLLFDELQAKTIRDIRPTNLDPATALGRILENTDWQVGIQQATGTASSNYYYQSNLSAFWDYLKKWRVEFKPRLTFSNGQITGRYIDIYNNMSDNYGKWYEYGDKLIEVEAEQANENIYTALIGLGKGEETGDGFGRKINFSDVVWSTANGDPVNKPIGQDYVEIPGATAIYGFREAVMDFPDIEDRVELLQAAYLELLNVSRPKVEFSSSAVETGGIDLGETITIIRDDMGIRYQTRVFELVRNFLDKTVKLFRFGDRIITSSAERIRDDREKTENKIKEQQSLLVAVRNQITDAYWGSDGYNYDLEVGNEYGLPAGLYSFDRPIDQDPTEVIYVGSGRALIANSKDVNGQWEWRTALTAEGFAGDQVVTGSITANKLSADVGQSLDLSSNTSINQAVKDIFSGEIMTVSSTAPESPTAGRLWLDTSVSPNLIKRWDGSDWVTVSDLTQLEELVASKANQSDLDSQIANVVSSIQASFDSEITQTNDTFNIKFSEMIDAINAAGDRISALSSEIETNIRFTADGIELGKSTNPVSVKILPDRVSFSEGGQEVAYFSNNKLYVTDIHVLTSLRIGDFAFFPRVSGNLSFRKVT